MKFFYYILNFLFLCVLIFDPQNTITKLKNLIFLFILGTTFLYFSFNQNKIKLPQKIIIFPIIFAASPIFSILENKLLRSNHIFNDLSLSKAFLFLLFIIPTYVFKQNILKDTIFLLNILSSLIIIIFILGLFFFDSSFFQKIIFFGSKYQNLLIGKRVFSESLSILQIYYVSSPLIFISLAYYSCLFFSNNANTLKNCSLLILSFFGLFCAGTKANILCAFLIPISIICYYSYLRNNSRNKNLLFLVLYLFCLFLILFIFKDFFLFNLNQSFDTANLIKFNLLLEYINILNDPITLLWGEGFGNFRYWETRHSFNYISELTYLELLRWFGLIKSIPIFFIIFYPFYYFFRNKTKNVNLIYLIFAYGFYLLISTLNPLLFSSLGILLLCIIYNEIFSNYNNFNEVNFKR